jgi:hypothetical protein
VVSVSFEEATMSYPVSRLQLSRQEVDGVLGAGHAAAHPEQALVDVGIGNPFRPAAVISARLERDLQLARD